MKSSPLSIPGFLTPIMQVRRSSPLPLRAVTERSTRFWEIVEIETKANDQANADKTELQEISSIIFFAMGLDAKLIGNTPGDTASSGGTDLRERFLVKQIQFAPLQQLMIRPLEVLSRFNDWDEHLVWQIDREVLTTLDNSKTGVAKQEIS